jgi:hypothetical protein
VTHSENKETSNDVIITNRIESVTCEERPEKLTVCDVIIKNKAGCIKCEVRSEAKEIIFT